MGCKASYRPLAVPSQMLASQGLEGAGRADGLLFPFAQAPRNGTCTEIVDGIIWLRMPLQSRLNHINLYLLADRDGWTLVDTGMNQSLCMAAWREWEGGDLKDCLPNRILLTHHHTDHMGLAAWLQARHGAQVWMSRRSAGFIRQILDADPDELRKARYEYLRQHGVEEAGAILDEASMRRTSATMRMPDIACYPAGGESIRFGKHDWDAIETDGHADGHLSLFDSKRNILIAGDQVLPAISPNVSLTHWHAERDVLGEYLASLDGLANLDRDTLVLPSHGLPYVGLKWRCKDLRAHHETRLKAVFEALDEPRCAFDLLDVLFRRKLSGAHLMMGAFECIAHLEHLRVRGAVDRQAGFDDILRYRRRDPARLLG